MKKMFVHVNCKSCLEITELIILEPYDLRHSSLRTLLCETLYKSGSRSAGLFLKGVKEDYLFPPKGTATKLFFLSEEHLFPEFYL